MFSSFVFLLLLISLACADLVPSQTGINEREDVAIALRNAVNAYRVQNNLSSLSCDRTAQLVAQLHAYDALLNPEAVTDSCNTHSWGKGFSGTPYTFKQCCYTSENAVCMWDKGKEVNPNFSKNVFENAYTGPATDADAILTAWKNSPGHNDVILNKGIWTEITWQSLGVGVATPTGSDTGKAFLIFTDGADSSFQVMINGQAVENCPTGSMESPSNSPAAAQSPSTSPAAAPSPSPSRSPASPVPPPPSPPPPSNKNSDDDSQQNCKAECVADKKSCKKKAKKQNSNDKKARKKAIKKCAKTQKSCVKKC